MEKKTGKDNKNELKKTLIIAVVIAITIYILYTIISLVEQPTNIVVVEYGKLTMEEEITRICY